KNRRDFGVRQVSEIRKVEYVVEEALELKPLRFGNLELAVDSEVEGPKSVQMKASARKPSSKPDFSFRRFEMSSVAGGFSAADVLCGGLVKTIANSAVRLRSMR